MRLLIDECLSPALVGEAHAAGHEAYHVVHLALAGAPDWEIARQAWSRELTFVTNNGEDFRRLYRRQPLHPGLVILVPNAARELQLVLFRAALAELAELGDLVNRAMEADFNGDAISRRVYELSRQE